jgi:CBS domain-containing protein
MKEHGVRRLPVIDGHELIGIVSQADVARNLPEDKIGDLVEAKEIEHQAARNTAGGARW